MTALPRMPATLVKRQNDAGFTPVNSNDASQFQDVSDNGDDDGDGDYNWYWSDEARAIKYGIFLGILLLGFLVIFGMWWHANRRIKKGLPPLRYHRWLVPLEQRMQFEPHLRPEQNFSFYQQQPGAPQYSTYPLHPLHIMPPPAYNPNYAQPPVYSGGPPEGATKVDPYQHSVPPPDHQHPSQTQNSNNNGESSSSSASANAFTVPPPAVPPPVAIPAYSMYPAQQNNNPFNNRS
ncbi:hypothetical protein RUND412_011101 [Rhizina undulata]